MDKQQIITAIEEIWKSHHVPGRMIKTDWVRYERLAAEILLSELSNEDKVRGMNELLDATTGRGYFFGRDTDAYLGEAKNMQEALEPTPHHFLAGAQGLCVSCGRPHYNPMHR